MLSIWRVSTIAMIGLVTFVAGALPTPAVAQALNPFETTVDALSSDLQARLTFYANHAPDVAIPEELKSGIQALIPAGTPAGVATKKLLALASKLDLAVLGALKKELYIAGVKVKGDPTSPSNLQRRKGLLLEFASVLKRQRIPVNFYFPDGLASIMKLKADIPEPGALVDKLLSDLAPKLRADVEAPKPAGQTSVDSGTGGLGSGGGTGSDIPDIALGSGGLSGYEAPVEAPVGGRPNNPPPRQPDDDGLWNQWRTTLAIGGLLIFVGSLVAVALPKIRARMGHVGGTMGMGRDGPGVHDEEHLRRAQMALSRGDFRKALSSLEKMDGELLAQEAWYQKAICHVRLLQTDEATTAAGHLDMTRMGLDELFRLGQAAEESKMGDLALRAFGAIESRDAAFRNVGPLIARLKGGNGRPAVVKATKDKGPDSPPKAVATSRSGSEK